LCERGAVAVIKRIDAGEIIEAVAQWR